MIKLVLASGSPRRRELMTMLGFTDFEVIPSQCEETAPEGLSPGEYAMHIARLKAEDIWSNHRDAVIISADTTVWYEGGVYGKPRDGEDAFNMLRTLSGKTHEVYTGVCVIRDGRISTAYEKTEVTFRHMSDGEILSYIATGEPMDKAGAYGAQGKGALFVSKINGDFYNVMGLPVCLLGSILKEQGVSVL